MSDEALNLDFLLEPVKPAGKVTLLGEEYELYKADLMENFLMMLALVDKVNSASKVVTSVNTAEDQERVQELSQEMDKLRADLRSMIRVMVPGLSEDLLRDKFPKLEQLYKLFATLVMEVQKTVPDSVKKNLDGKEDPKATPAT